MRRSHSPRLRGSVQQSSVRMRPREVHRFGIFIRLGILFSSAFLLVGLGFWLWHNEWPQKQAHRLSALALQITQKAQFSVKNIIVEGRQQTNKENLSLALGVMPNEPILGVDILAAQNRIAKLPWTESVTVERRLPGTILVHLNERVPMARWQHENHTVVIDGQGKELTEAKIDQFTQLPLVVGAGAPEETQSLLNELKKFPVINDKVVAAVWVSERRWDLHFQPKIVVRLPAKDLPSALKQLAVLITEQNILDRDIVAIDLRIPERLAIEPSTTTNNHTTGNMRL